VSLMCDINQEIAIKAQVLADFIAEFTLASSKQDEDQRAK